MYELHVIDYLLFNYFIWAQKTNRKMFSFVALLIRLRSFFLTPASPTHVS
jgi:hypothetical protein